MKRLSTCLVCGAVQITDVTKPNLQGEFRCYPCGSACLLISASRQVY